jgi:hypothetical protein
VWLGIKEYDLQIFPVEISHSNIPKFNRPVRDETLNLIIVNPKTPNSGFTLSVLPGQDIQLSAEAL